MADVCKKGDKKGDTAVCNKTQSCSPHSAGLSPTKHTHSTGCFLQSCSLRSAGCFLQSCTPCSTGCFLQGCFSHNTGCFLQSCSLHSAGCFLQSCFPHSAGCFLQSCSPHSAGCFLQSCPPHSAGCSYKAVPHTARGCLPGSHLVCISRDAGDARHTEVKWSQREPCLVHEGNQEPSQAAVHMNGDVVLLSQLSRQTQPPISNLSDGCQCRYRDDLYSPYKCQGKQGTPSQ